jgi:hypothetical protein
VEENVEVAANAESLQTASSALGTVIDATAVNDLPLNGHNFTQLLTLTPGVTPVQNEQGAGSGTSYQQDVSIPGTPTFRPNVNGQWNRSNLYYLDGIWNSTNVASGYAITPIIESVEEFKVQSHNDDAEYGGSMGGTINLVSRSGTSNLHGSAWEDVRNNFFDARDPFLDALTTGPAPYHQNEFGAIVGGPVFIPKLYDGRKRTFFFFAYDGWRYSKPDQTFYYVPTAAELAGDFSQSIVDQNIYDPSTLTPSATAPSGYTAQQFPWKQDSIRTSESHWLSPFSRIIGIGPITRIRRCHNITRRTTRLSPTPAIPIRSKSTKIWAQRILFPGASLISTPSIPTRSPSC